MKQPSQKEILARWKETSKEKGIPLRIILFSLSAFVILAIVGFWTGHAVKETLESYLTQVLKTTLKADLAALEIWAENELYDVNSMAENPNLRKHVEDLFLIKLNFSSDSTNIISSQPLRQIQAILKSTMEDRDYHGFAVFDRTGYILATSDKEKNYVGTYLSPTFMPLLAQVFEGKTILEKPHMKETFLTNVTLDDNRPVMILAAPVYTRMGELNAALAFVVNPDQDFTRILSVARLGETGDTYAFDEKGFLISNSRFEKQLEEIGLIAPDARSILNVQIRDPGGNLTLGFQTKAPMAARPFTKMAASAISDQSEKSMRVDVKGYRDYRGVKVIGAWQWLSKYGFGVATEVSFEEAFGLLRPLKIAFIALFVLLIAASSVIILSSFFIHRLRNRIDQVKQLGQYFLEEKIGQGGMGKVYKARHAMLKRPTAVKLLSPEAASEDAIARFEREVQLTSQLTHPNTIEIYDYGRTPKGIFYYAMEYLYGVTLDELIEMEGPVPAARVIYILKQICFSLQEAHEIGLIHRDIKPLNIILCERGGQSDVVKVLDFGLVKDIANQNQAHMTAANVVMGTPSYVAPERLKEPLNIDARSDLYSLGSVIFNLLTGCDVFTGSNSTEITYHIMKTPPPRPSECVDKIMKIPTLLDNIVVDCLAKNPAQRPQSAGEIISIVDSIHDVEPWQQKDAQKWWRDNLKRIEAKKGKSLKKYPSAEMGIKSKLASSDEETTKL